MLAREPLSPCNDVRPLNKKHAPARVHRLPCRNIESKARLGVDADSSIYRELLFVLQELRFNPDPTSS